MRVVAVMLCVAAGASYAQPDWHAVLDGVRARVKQSVERLHNYMCTETIDRTEFLPDNKKNGEPCQPSAAGKPRPFTSDRLRLDVAIGESQEMYSWVGENRFEDRSLAELVKVGASSTGSFASSITSVLNSNVATFTYIGQKTENGRTLMEFSYRVPLEKSNYYFSSHNGKVLTAYEGSFLVDPGSFDLVQFIDRTTGLPASTGACEAETTLEYGRVRLRGDDLLLATEARLSILSTNGIRSENRTVFSGCHEFLGESSLSFEVPADAAGGAAPKTAAASDQQLPPGRAFQLALADDIDIATAAVGDPISARLTSPISDRSGAVLIPAGATVTGRVVEMRRYFVPPSLDASFQLETLHTGATSRPFAATLESVGQSLATKRGARGTLHYRAKPGLAQVEFADSRGDTVIKAGQDMKWVTVRDSAADAEPAGDNAPRNPSAVSETYRLPAESEPKDITTLTGPRNLDFQEGVPGEIPPGWSLWRGRGSVGSSAELRTKDCKVGPRCAAVLPAQAPRSVGSLTQSFDAKLYRGKIVRLRAWIRLDEQSRGDRAQMWLRVDRANGQTGFVDNMENRPLKTAGWKLCEIQGRVDNDAATIHIGVLSSGSGRAWIDGVSFEIVSKPAK